MRSLDRALKAALGVVFAAGLALVYAGLHRSYQQRATLEGWQK